MDLQLLCVALEKAQLSCTAACLSHERSGSGARLSLTEVAPVPLQEDLVARLALTCTSCNRVSVVVAAVAVFCVRYYLSCISPHQATIFPTSPFCEVYPANYTVNKELLKLLGPEAFFKLAKYLQVRIMGKRSTTYLLHQQLSSMTLPFQITQYVGHVNRRPHHPHQLVMSLTRAQRDPAAALVAAPVPVNPSPAPRSGQPAFHRHYKPEPRAIPVVRPVSSSLIRPRPAPVAPTPIRIQPRTVMVPAGLYR